MNACFLVKGRLTVCSASAMVVQLNLRAWPPSLGLQTRAAGLLTTIVAISAECAGMPGKSPRKGDGFGINSLYR